MIHLDSVEKSAQRISDYLHDPSAFGDKLNANRRERLTTLHKSLIDSANILASKLGISIDPTIESMCADIQQIKEMLMNQDYMPFIPYDSGSDEKETAKIHSVGSKGKHPRISKKQYVRIYKMFESTLLSATCAEYDNYIAQEFTSLAWEYFAFRLQWESPFKAHYNIFQIAECIEKLFVAFACSRIIGQGKAFDAMYSKWVNSVQAGSKSDIGYQTPSVVMQYAEFDDRDVIDEVNLIWRGLTGGSYSTIARFCVKDDEIKQAFLHSNPFSVWNDYKKKSERDEAAAL